MIEAYEVSAFSKENKGGNKAGVILEHDNVSYDRRIEIAKSLGYSETVFVSKSDIATYKLEYYTPVEEVPLCGHATIATFSLMHILNLLESNTCTIETKVGILRINVNEDGLVFMEQNCPMYYEILNKNDFVKCMNSTCIHDSLPLQIVSTGLKDIIFPIHNYKELDELNPNFDSMATISKELGVVGIHAFVLHSKEGLDCICRNFAPLYGIDEESATGTASCALAGYLFKYVEKKEEYIFEQGYQMGLPSRIVVRLAYHEDTIESIYVGGYGYVNEKKVIG